MKSGLLVVGAGGHGSVVADAAHEQGLWSQIAFLDDRPTSKSLIADWPILGATDQASKWLKKYTDLIVAIGDNTHRIQLIQKFKDQGFNIPVICHPTACVSAYADIGAGSVLAAQCAVNAGARLGRGCIINTGATVDHDNVLGDAVHVSPGAHLGGGVQVGANSWIGIGARVREQISIGSHVIVGAGAAVVDDVGDNIQVVGVPARPLT